MTDKKKTADQSSEKMKVLESVLEQIDKQYGKNSIMYLGKNTADFSHSDVISTGSILIDNALGIRGFPRGRIIEIFGPEATGKTTLALQVLAQAQAQGGVCAFIDAEHSLDPTYASNLGINTNDLLISQPDYGEQALDIAEMLIRSGAVDVIVVDSVAALVPKAELEGEMGDVHMGLQARLMSQALRKLTPVVHKSRTALIFINQVRANISSFAFAEKEVTTGGKALKFYASLRLDVRRIQAIKNGDAHIGNRLMIKVVKNKMAAPFKKAEVDLIFSEGISPELDLIGIALELGVIKQSGAWFSYGTERLSQGKDQLRQLLREHKDVQAKIRKQVLELLGAQPVQGARLAEGEKGSEKSSKKQVEATPA
jgi:recombination protein RecA